LIKLGYVALGPEQIDALLRKWLAILPHPFSAAEPVTIFV